MVNGLDNYVTVNGRKYRKGYTTGSCAAAASKAAVSMLLSGKILDYITINTPAGIILNLPLSDTAAEDNYARCSVIKDGGDDPDITSGLKIFAEARFTEKTGINIKADEGIGVVTLPGLKVEVGRPAINPVPMRMIINEVSEVLPEDRGVEITLSIPGGEEVAQRTYNPKLGIVGGLSILGTSGIVVPMSEEAWKDSLALELGILAAKGKKNAIFAFGNYGEDFINSKLAGCEGDRRICENVVKISNFVGFMLDKAVEFSFEKILMVGHMGKLIKVAAGIFHTHSRVADGRMEILAAYAALEGAPQEVTARIYECRTTDAAAEIIEQEGLRRVYERIVFNVSKRCSEYSFNRLEIGSVLFNADNTLLAADKTAGELLEKLRSGNG